MKAILMLAAAAAVAITASPALAKSKKKITVYGGTYYGETYAPAYGFWNGIPAPVHHGWYGNDPSLGHPSAASLTRNSGRCVEDLGYGRFKYCGW